MTELKYEFDNWEEYYDAMEHLERYHDCEQCHGKIVAITLDKVKGTCCGYCHQPVRYPHIKKEVFEKWLLNEVQKKNENNT